MGISAKNVANVHALEQVGPLDVNGGLLTSIGVDESILGSIATVRGHAAHIDVVELILVT